MNAVLTKVREQGAFIIHAPSPFGAPRTGPASSRSATSSSTVADKAATVVSRMTRQTAPPGMASSRDEADEGGSIRSDCAAATSRRQEPVVQGSQLLVAGGSSWYSRPQPVFVNISSARK